MKRHTRRQRSGGSTPTVTASATQSPTTPAPSWSGREGGLYPISEDTAYRGWRPALDRDARFLINRYKHRAMISDARYIYTGVGQVGGAVHEKANFAVGSAWIPQYAGKDKVFKAAFTERMRLWMKNCDLRGLPYDWQRNVWLASKSLDVDGECYWILTRSEFGRPRIQCLEAHRIGTPYAVDTVPSNVPGYAGRRVHNGIVYDDAMRPLAYNLLPEDTLLPSRDTAWNLLPAGAVIHHFDPRWYSQSRGIPTLCYGILDWYDIGEIRDAEKVGVKSSSRVALLEYNETGRADPGPALMAGRAVGDTSKVNVDSRLIENGLIRYFKAGSGNRLEAFSADRPGATWEGFIDHIARSAHKGMDWPLEMHDMSKVGGASVRALTGQVQRSVNQRQDVLWTPALSAVLYAVGAYIRLGELPFTEDWYDIVFTTPPKFSVDVGRDAENRRQDVAMGIRGLDDCFGEEGEGDVETVFRRRAAVWQARARVAQEENVPPEALFNPAAASQPAYLSIGPEPGAAAGPSDPLV